MICRHNFKRRPEHSFLRAGRVYTSADETAARHLRHRAHKGNVSIIILCRYDHALGLFACDLPRSEVGDDHHTLTDEVLRLVGLLDTAENRTRLGTDLHAELQELLKVKSENTQLILTGIKMSSEIEGLVDDIISIDILKE